MFPTTNTYTVLYNFALHGSPSGDAAEDDKLTSMEPIYKVFLVLGTLVCF